MHQGTSDSVHHTLNSPKCDQMSLDLIKGHCDPLRYICARRSCSAHEPFYDYYVVYSIPSLNIIMTKAKNAIGQLLERLTTGPTRQSSLLPFFFSSPLCCRTEEWNPKKGARLCIGHYLRLSESCMLSSLLEIVQATTFSQVSLQPRKRLIWKLE